MKPPRNVPETGTQDSSVPLKAAIFMCLLSDGYYSKS